MSGKLQTSIIQHGILAAVKIRASSSGIIGFSRSLLALGMLLTLIFNDIDFIIPHSYIQGLNLNALKYRCNFFLLFNASHLVETQILAILLLLFTITGYCIRITSLLQFWISASFFLLRPSYFAEGDNVNMLLTLLLIPVCLFDERNNHWNEPAVANKSATGFQNIFLLAIKLQVAFIYFDSVHDKLELKEWRNGTVIYYWFTHNFFGLDPRLSDMVQPFLLNKAVLIVTAWGTLTFEALLAAAFLFPGRAKLVLLTCGILFHFCIMLIHGYASFFWAMSAALFLYLYPSQRSFSSTIACYHH